MIKENEEQLLKYTLAKLGEAPKLVKNNIEKQGKKIKHRESLPLLKTYVNNFLKGEELGRNQRLVILPGLRGVGKTTMLFQIYDYLIKERKIEQDRVLYFSADELKTYLNKNILDVTDTFVQDVHNTSYVNLEKELFILIDESHFDSKWSEAAKIIFDKTKKIFLIFTGSSALNLEMSVDSARRATKETVFPMNFSEYLTLKYGISLSNEITDSIRDLIFKGDKKSIKSSIKKEKEILKELIKLERPLEKEFIDFLCYNGFPFSLDMSQTESHEKIFDMIERVIEKDVFSLKSFNTDTRGVISRTLTFLALQSLGGTSVSKLSERMKTSPTLISNILDILEKTHLIFSLKPYGGAGKVVRKPWKYYFLSPSINSSIRFKLGSYNPREKEMLGVLAEGLVASYFIKIKETLNLGLGIFYDSAKGGVDFILQDPKNNIIPVEVGLGKKDKNQVLRAIKKYKSDYGILICDCPSIKKEGKVIKIPLKTFSFI